VKNYFIFGLMGLGLFLIVRKFGADWLNKIGGNSSTSSSQSEYNVSIGDIQGSQFVEAAQASGATTAGPYYDAGQYVSTGGGAMPKATQGHGSQSYQLQ
jgi:hypothetical protein